MSQLHHASLDHFSPGNLSYFFQYLYPWQVEGVLSKEKHIQLMVSRPHISTKIPLQATKLHCLFLLLWFPVEKVPQVYDGEKSIGTNVSFFFFFLLLLITHNSLYF